MLLKGSPSCILLCPSFLYEYCVSQSFWRHNVSYCWRRRAVTFDSNWLLDSWFIHVLLLQQTGLHLRKRDSNQAQFFWSFFFFLVCLCQSVSEPQVVSRRQHKIEFAARCTTSCSCFFYCNSFSFLSVRLCLLYFPPVDFRIFNSCSRIFLLFLLLSLCFFS